MQTFFFILMQLRVLKGKKKNQPFELKTIMTVLVRQSHTHTNAYCHVCEIYDQPSIQYSDSFYHFISSVTYIPNIKHVLYGKSYSYDQFSSYTHILSSSNVLLYYHKFCSVCCHLFYLLFLDV